MIRLLILALVALGKEENCLAELSDGLVAFESALKEGNRLLLRSLVNPAISQQEKNNVVREVAAHLSLNPLVTNTIMLLLERDRLSIIPHLVVAYTQMADKLLNRLRAVVSSAKELDAQEQQSVRTTLAQAHSIPMENLFISFEVDAQLIGGLVAKVGDRIYDASIRTRLNELEQILTQ